MRMLTAVQKRDAMVNIDHRFGCHCNHNDPVLIFSVSAASAGGTMAACLSIWGSPKRINAAYLDEDDSRSGERHLVPYATPSEPSSGGGCACYEQSERSVSTHNIEAKCEVPNAHES
jgi:hypothetical protein